MRCHIARLFIVACAVVCSAFTGGHVALFLDRALTSLQPLRASGGLGTSGYLRQYLPSITGGTRPGWVQIFS